jgi:glycosyltransferase involved in cell wall biosynthesis
LHTDVHPHVQEKEGYNLLYAVESFGIANNIKFSPEKLSIEEMNILCNVSDCGVNISSCEGFGLNPLEMLYCAKPIIVLKTGGLTRQVIDPRDGTVYGVALEPSARTFIGGGSVPYIYADHVKHEDVADGFMKMFEMPSEERKALGLKGREYALEEFSMSKMVSDWDRTLEDTINNFSSNKNLWSATSF